jgi:hypothetical protein
VLLITRDHTLRVFVNRVLRRIFGPRRGEVRDAGENYIMMIFIISILQVILLWVKEVIRVDPMCQRYPTFFET